MKTKRLLVIMSILTMALMSITGYYKISHTFTSNRWVNNPSQRVKVVDDLIAKHSLIGMDKEEVIKLLGEDSGEEVYFQEEDNLVYYLGNEQSWISIDSEWLIIEFISDKVSTFRVVTD